YHGFPESCQVGAALGSKLPVHKRIIIFPVFAGVRHGDLYIISFEVNDGVTQTFFIRMPPEQVEQAIGRMVFLSVENDGEACIEESIVPDLILQELRTKMKIFKNAVVRLK